MCRKTALTGAQLREIRGFVAAKVGEPVLEHQSRLLDDLVKDSPAIRDGEYEYYGDSS
jgi:hypothetical protein